MNTKKINVWLPFMLSLTMIAGIYLGYRMRDNMPGKSFFHLEKRRPVQEIMDLINNRYVDDVKLDELADTAIQAMLSKLDPHSVYIPAEELQMVNEELAGNFFGIGIEFNIFDDTLNVINVMKDGPGSKSGIMTGDKFIKVDDSLVAGNNTNADTFRKLLRGKKGTKVLVTYLRSNSSKQVTLTRDAIPVSSVDASYMLNSQTGYIRLNKFSKQTYREFMQSLEALNKKGMKKLILDLRNNGGGILEEAVEIADEFLEGDKLITYTEGKHIEKKEYRCRRVGQFEKGGLVVLTDEGTASASEVLIGALQDWDRATIIGRRTFGKGLVQEQFDLSDKSALRLTIARYYTPVGRSIQRPYSNGEDAYYDEINNRYQNGGAQSRDSVKNDTSKIFKTKAGKIVYGKGGITPDYFIAFDTSGYTKNSAKIYANGSIGNFAYHYYLQNLNQFKKYKTPAEFSSRMFLTDADWNQFISIAAKDSVDISRAGAKEKANLVNYLKASIARQLWRTEGYFEVFNSTDEAVLKALEIVK